MQLLRSPQKPNWPFVLNRASVQANGLVGWWPGGPLGGKIFDCSKFGALHATATNVTPGAASGWTAGKDGGYAFRFDGSNDYADTGTTTFYWTLAGSSAFSLAMWLKPVAFQASAPNISHFFNWGTSSLDEIVFFRFGDSGLAKEKLQFGFRTGGGQTKLAGARTNVVDTWIHACAVYTGANMYIYVNGVQDSTKAQTGTVETPATSSIVDFGRSRSNARYYNGCIEDARVYNRALSVAEVAALYHPATRWQLRYQPGVKRWFVPKTAAAAATGPIGARMNRIPRLGAARG